MFYIVATPIGNLKEITYRAVEVLKSVDIILAEDTRHSAALLKAYGVTAPMRSYQKFNERSMCAGIIGELKSGKNIALISDAGMPLISDPGSVIVSELILNKLEYTVISGACAAINALVLSGMDLSSFCMAGFLPEKNIDRVRHVAKFKDLQCTLAFYISPHSLQKDLDFLFSQLGGRRAVLVREISKLYEQTVRFSLGETAQITLKGEFVVVVEGAPKKAQKLCALSVDEHVEHYRGEGIEERDAIKRVAQDRGVAKSIIYNLRLKNADEGKTEAK